MLKKIKVSDFLFFLAYGLFLAVSMLSITFYAKYFGKHINAIAYIFCLLLLTFREVMGSKLKKEDFLLLPMLLILCFIGFAYLGVKLAMLFVLVYCSRNISFTKIARFTVVLSSFLLCFIIVSSYVGVIENYIIGQGTSREREFLGFLYALYGPAIYLNIVMLYVYCNKNKMRWPSFLTIIMINFFFYLKTNSRFSFAAVFAMLLLTVWFKRKPEFFEKRQKKFKLLTWSFLIFGGASLYLTMTYNPLTRWKYAINDFLDQRLTLGQTSLVKNGICLFGQHIEMVGNGLSVSGKAASGAYSWVDNTYLQILLIEGLAFFVLYYFLWTWGMRCCYQKRDYFLLIIISFLAAESTINGAAQNLFTNTFWLALGNLIFEKNTLLHKSKVLTTKQLMEKNE